MALICILIGLITERATDWLETRRNFSWYDRYSHWLFNTLPGLANQQRSSIVILLFPVLLLTGILQGWLDDKMLGISEFIFGLAIFAFSLGPSDLNRQLERYLQARENGDADAARDAATDILQKEAPEDSDQQTVDIMRAVLHEPNDRFFAVIFWFVVLGPLGALMYRLTSYTMRNSNSASLSMAARQLQGILAWPPAHLIAMGYALTGNYEGAKQEFTNKNRQDDLYECNYLTLITAGQGALKDCAPGDETACIRSARALVLRTLVVWLAIIAVLTLIGWMS